jgi:hypothetical protein
MPDVVLFDVNQPDHTGLHVFHEIRGIDARHLARENPIWLG